MTEEGGSVCVAAMDPGTTNIGTWIGVCDPKKGTVRTISMIRGGANKDDDTRTKKSKKQPVYAISAQAALDAADACMANKVVSSVVETAPQWNMAARISAATIYGVFRGRGVPVQFSSSVTKARAMQAFAKRWDVKLAGIPETLDRKKKGDAEKIRRINKQNAKTVAKAVIAASGDGEGARVLELYKDKQDDVCDAMLLACGPLFEPEKKKRKKKNEPSPEEKE
jgi:hypothetical protein